MAEINEQRYIYDLIPDYNVVEYAEKDFWTKNSAITDENCDNIWYEMHSIDSEYKFSVSSYRCLLISEYELEFADSNLNCVLLSNYAPYDRYAYVMFDTEEAEFRKDSHEAKLQYCIDYQDTYVIEVRF